MTPLETALKALEFYASQPIWLKSDDTIGPTAPYHDVSGIAREAIEAVKNNTSIPMPGIINCIRNATTILGSNAKESIKKEWVDRLDELANELSKNCDWNAHRKKSATSAIPVSTSADKPEEKRRVWGCHGAVYIDDEETCWEKGGTKWIECPSFDVAVYLEEGYADVTESTEGIAALASLDAQLKGATK